MNVTFCRPLLNCLAPDHPFLISSLKMYLEPPEVPPQVYYLANTSSLNLEEYFNIQHKKFT